MAMGAIDISTFSANGVVNHMRTGNIIVDMILAMIVPFLVRYCLEARMFGRVLDAITNLLSKHGSRKEVVRSISFSHTPGRGTYSVFDQRNEYLQKAISLYFTERNKLNYKNKASVALTALHDTRYHHTYDKYDPMANYRLTWLAPENEWVDLHGDDKIAFRHYTNVSNNAENNGSNASSTREMVVYELKCSERGAGKKIDALIKTAVEWYKSELMSSRDDARYLYTMNVQERYSFGNTDKDNGDSDATKYKRYKLSDHKTFESLFFPEKAGLLQLLDDFQKKSGKYGVSGYPHKLGLLLHGPPGTGKTSLIKALAQATGRSIINVPLAQIKTNQMLMDVMYDLKVKVEGEQDARPQLEYKDVIFVIEDVDAASKIVLRRDGKHGVGSAATSGGGTSEQMQAGQIQAALVKAARQGAGRNIKDHGGGNKNNAGGSGRGSPASSSSPAGSSPGGGGSGSGSGNASQGEVEGPPVPTRTMSDLIGDLVKPRPDELNLAGLLNVLDGVVDTPGRLLILTSNHPEQLDPALIRPGRVDRLIHLGYLQAEAASQMIAHYFGAEGLSETQATRLEVLLRKRQETEKVGGEAPLEITPAMLEQLCQQFQTVDELLDELSSSSTANSASQLEQLDPLDDLTAAFGGGASEAMPLAGDVTEDLKEDSLGSSSGSLGVVMVKRQVSGG